VAHPK